MRLLNTSTLRLCEFHDDGIPDYAILSHTWEDGEVSFQAMETAVSELTSAFSEDSKETARLKTWAAIESKSSSGYTKIAKCCRLAASEGWEHIWIDTCCIDKTSSAELSEAINSMYRWYQEAQVCYVYMTDVYSASPQGFQWSRWFTRGWTLQELLAPSTVVFFDKDWREFGTRWSLREQISRATSIKFESMKRPKNASIATKMSWASNRKTTRVEDIAYCLMGLFDVNMPLLYGEGPKAFMRLQYEIAESGHHDESIFAWRDAGLSSSGMFARSPEAFADSGDVCCVRNPNPRAQPLRITKASLFLDRLIARKDIGEESTTVILNCAPADSESTYLAVEVRLGSSGYHVRSSPGHLAERSFLRGLEPIKLTQFVNDTLQMSLMYGDNRSTSNSSIQKQRVVVMPSYSFIPNDGFYLDRVDQSRITHPSRSWWLVPDPSLGLQKNGTTSSKMVLLEGRTLKKPQFSLSGARIFDINLQDDQPVAVMMFPTSHYANMRRDFAVILTASDAAPKIDVLVQSPPTPIRETVKHYLETPGENSLNRPNAEADRFVVPLLPSGMKSVQITFRKRIVDDHKVYCVYISRD